VQASIFFGKKTMGEPNYRKLKTIFKEENQGNWVILVPYPFGPNENLLEEIEGSPPTAPDSKHWLGTDNRGRDVFARLAYGFRISITFALIITFFSYLLGIIIGACLGYYGGLVDLLGQRFIEIVSGIPVLFTTMILVSFMKLSFFMLCVVLIVLGGWVGQTYYMRGEFYREKAKDYTLAAIALGASDFRVIFKHILPNAITPMITLIPFTIVGDIGALVSLDFLGLGLPPPTPSWGELLSQGTSDIRYWWLVTFPLLALFMTLMAITFIGEGVRESFDPKKVARLR
jgi:microcin C transport system permease protein